MRSEGERERGRERGRGRASEAASERARGGERVRGEESHRAEPASRAAGLAEVALRLVLHDDPEVLPEELLVRLADVRDLLARPGAQHLAHVLFVRRPVLAGIVWERAGDESKRSTSR